MGFRLILFALCLSLGLSTANKSYFVLKAKDYLFKASYALTQKSGLTAEEKQAILDLTNALRLKISKGDEKHGADGLMPNATNMLAVEWDDDLAAFAQKSAETCSNEHSDLNIKGTNYNSGMMSENMCGPIVTVATDMYGEVGGWSYVKQECQEGRQCGHYNTLVAWSNFRMGCGYQYCSIKSSDGVPTVRDNLICEFAPFRTAGIDVSEGEKRYRYAYEYQTNLKPGDVSSFSNPTDKYAPTQPCSECPQGWDYCMGGGLCATKAQCESDPGNKCTCIHSKDKCEANGGTFDAGSCQCACPAKKMGVNCAAKCEDVPGVIICGMTCGNSQNEIFQCPGVCGSCGKSVSRAYKYWMEERKAKNKDGLKVRYFPPGPKTPVPKSFKAPVRTYKGKPCKNTQFKDYQCEELRLRKFCNDKKTRGSWRNFCKATCNSCGSTEGQDEVNKALKSQGYTPPPPDSGPTPPPDTGWSEGGGDGW